MSACVHYRSMPLTEKSVEDALALPDAHEIRIRASSIRHPILRPISFNLKDGLSVDEAAILAVIQNPILKAERDKRDISNAEIIQAGILPNPDLSYSFQTPVGGDTEGKSDAYGMGFNWEITSLIARGARKSSMRFKARSVDLSIAWKEWQIAEAAKLAIYRVVLCNKRLFLKKRLFDLYEDLFSQMKKGIGLGVVTRPEIISTKDRVEDASMEVIRARAELQDSWLNLKKILGIPASMKLRLEKGIRLMKVQEIPAAHKLIEGLDKRRLDLVALRYGYKSQDERLREAILAQFPKISLGFTAERDTDGAKIVGFGIGISIPIFNRNQGKIAIEKTTRKMLFDEYSARLFEARSEIYHLREGLYFDFKQLDRLNRIIKRQARINRLYYKAFRMGNASILDYYQRMIQLNKKRLQKVDLEKHIVSLEIGLEIASGSYIFSGDGHGK